MAHKWDLLPPEIIMWRIGSFLRWTDQSSTLPVKVHQLIFNHHTLNQTTSELKGAFLKQGFIHCHHDKFPVLKGWGWGHSHRGTGTAFQDGNIFVSAVQKYIHLKCRSPFHDPLSGNFGDYGGVWEATTPPGSNHRGDRVGGLIEKEK